MTEAVYFMTTKKTIPGKFGLLIGLLLLFIPIEAFGQCSGERWPVKIGTDLDAQTVNMTPTQTTIANLVALRQP